MDVIAQRYGYRDWRVIYASQCNADFRRKRSDPSRIHPGDNVFIPPSKRDIVASLIRRRDLLLALKQQHAELVESEIAEITREFAKVTRQGEQVDAIAFVATILVNITQIVSKGLHATKLTGDALTALNRELTKDVVKLAYEPSVEKALDQYKDAKSLDNNIITHYSQKTVGVLLGLTSPSWWANLISNKQSGMSWKEAINTKPKDVLNTVSAELRASQTKVCEDLDRKIDDLNRKLNELNSPISEPTPWLLHRNVEPM